MGMRNHNLLERELFLAKYFQNSFNLVSGIDHHGLMGLLIADNRAVALQRPDGKDFVDHANMLIAGSVHRPVATAVYFIKLIGQGSTMQSKSRTQAALLEITLRYFFGVSTGVGTLSMTEEEPRRLVM